MTKALARRTEVQTLKLPVYDDNASRTLAEQYAENHQKVFELVMQCRVDSPETAERATQFAHKIKEQKALVEKELEFATELRRLANQYSKRWNPAIQPLVECLDHLRSQLEGYTERSRAAVMTALPQAQTQEEIAVATETIVPLPDGAIERVEWRAEIVDVTKLPAEYFLIDHARLNREAKALKEAFNVPGARAVPGVGVAFRA